MIRLTNHVKLYSGSRKTAKATAAIQVGSGRIKINKVPVELIMPKAARDLILTPLILAGDLRDKVDIDVKVKGGGFMGRAEAAAIAISRALVDWGKDSELKQRITKFDKNLLVEDPRRKEPKKFGGPGARRRKQKSYR
ncbi:MAG: 30S ribosomal protein S9 [Candidatus Methylarchaceae archaeon HK01B]|nr:30S ribosomal protein S9 [Candidatus Methylarchaceae archaeon HK01B]